MAQHQTSRWHLLNVGSGGEFHAVHFHGIPFGIGKDQEHRMGIFNLYPGKQKGFNLGERNALFNFGNCSISVVFNVRVNFCSFFFNKMFVSIYQYTQN